MLGSKFLVEHELRFERALGSLIPGPFDRGLQLGSSFQIHPRDPFFILDQKRVKRSVAVEFYPEELLHFEEEPILVKGCYVSCSGVPDLRATVPLQLRAGVELEPKMIEFPVSRLSLEHRTAEGEGAGAAEL